MRTILLDIEGTTTSISFVKEVLFPYARMEMETYLKYHWDDEGTQGVVYMVEEEGKKDEEYEWRIASTDEGRRREVLHYLLWQMDKDKKTTSLKGLQGKIWKKGYADGVLKGHVYGDVPEAFEKWVKEGREIYIYSSGSVEAQILLFKHSEAGDLTKFISGYFDTTSGAKTEKQSYLNIAEKIGKPVGEILFLTDIPKEAYAAKNAGMNAKILLRPGNMELTSQEFDELDILKDFNELELSG